MHNTYTSASPWEFLNRWEKLLKLKIKKNLPHIWKSILTKTKNLGFVFSMTCIGIEWLHHWTKEGLLMSSNWASAGPLTWFPTFLPLTCRDTDLMMTVRRLEHLVCEEKAERAEVFNTWWSAVEHFLWPFKSSGRLTGLMERDFILLPVGH